MYVHVKRNQMHRPILVQGIMCFQRCESSCYKSLAWFGIAAKGSQNPSLMIVCVLDSYSYAEVASRRRMQELT